MPRRLTRMRCPREGHGAIVVTRNGDDFQEGGMTAANPWNG